MTEQPTMFDPDEEKEVAAALARETQDGPGFESVDELPDEDFAGYTDDDAEVNE